MFNFWEIIILVVFGLILFFIIKLIIALINYLNRH